jgi:hypothetical protein
MKAMTSSSGAALVAAQIGSALLPDNDQWFNRFQVKSTSSSSFYTVGQRRSDSVWGCSCNGWRHYRHCKHLTDILGRLSRLTASPALNEPVVVMLRSARAAYLDLDPTPIKITKPASGRILDL